MRASRIRGIQKSLTGYIEEICEIEMLRYLSRYETPYLNKSLFQIREILLTERECRSR